MIPDHDGLIVNNKKGKDERTLFPGHQLQKLVRSVQRGSEIPGTVCEKLTVNLLGGHQSLINSTADVCPDAVNEEKRLYVESKACQIHHAFKVSVSQLQNYRRVRFNSYRFNDPFAVLYALWAYSARKITGVPAKHAKNPGPWKPKTEQQVIEAVVESIERVYILDLSFMHRLFRMADREKVERCSVKDYASWRGYSEPSFHVLNVGHGFLKRLRENTEEVLDELLLTSEYWRWKSIAREFEEIVIDGMRFESPPFSCFELIRPESWYEYPKYMYNPDVPF